MSRKELADFGQYVLDAFHPLMDEAAASGTPSDQITAVKGYMQGVIDSFGMEDYLPDDADDDPYSLYDDFARAFGHSACDENYDDEGE